MYAVISSGGKQYRVEEGQRLAVERLASEGGSEIDLSPVLVVDGERVLATPDQLDAARVTARIVEPEVKGEKIRGFTYKPKTNQRRRWGHRQRHSLIEITAISAAGDATPKARAKKQPAKATAKKAPAKKTAAKKTPAKKAPARKRSV
jgi:large subunit ribosomal protein L21